MTPGKASSSSSRTGPEPTQIESRLDRLDDLGEQYLEACSPIDLADHQPGRHEAVAEGLSLEGLDHLTSVRTSVLRALDGLDGLGPVDEAARRQLHDWVSTEHDLMESGEKYRQFHELGGPFYQQSVAIRTALAEPEIHWKALAGGFDSLALTAANFVDSLSEGISRGVLGNREESEAILSQLDAVDHRSKDNLIEHYLAATTIPEDVESLVRESAERFRAALAELAVFLRHDYLPHAPNHNGIGVDRYQLWAEKLLGPGVDLFELHDYCWHEFRSIRADMEAIVEHIDPGFHADDVMWHLNSAPKEQARTATGVLQWAEQVLAGEAEAVDGRIVNLPAQAREFRLMVNHDQGSARIKVVSPSRDGTRSGFALILPNAEIQIPTWTLYSAVHAYIFPGVHVLNCELIESRLRRFQQVLMGTVTRAGWATESLALGASLLPSRQTHVAQLATLNSQARQVLRVCCDIGYHMGLKVPKVAPDFVGETWTKELVALSLAHWANMSRAEAGAESARIVHSPGNTLGAAVGGRIWADARLRTQRRAGESFDLCAYHERALRVAPGGAALLSDELYRIGDSQQTGPA